jgi:hypothetical protein
MTSSAIQSLNQFPHPSAYQMEQSDSRFQTQQVKYDAPNDSNHSNANRYERSRSFSNIFEIDRPRITNTTSHFHLNKDKYQIDGITKQFDQNSLTNGSLSTSSQLASSSSSSSSSSSFQNQSNTQILPAFTHQAQGRKSLANFIPSSTAAASAQSTSNTIQSITPLAGNGVSTYNVDSSSTNSNKAIVLANNVVNISPPVLSRKSKSPPSVQSVLNANIRATGVQIPAIKEVVEKHGFLFVTSIVKNSPAELAGLKREDIISQVRS